MEDFQDGREGVHARHFCGSNSWWPSSKFTNIYIVILGLQNQCEIIYSISVQNINFIVFYIYTSDVLERLFMVFIAIVISFLYIFRMLSQTLIS